MSESPPLPLPRNYCLLMAKSTKGRLFYSISFFLEATSRFLFLFLLVGLREFDYLGMQGIKIIEKCHPLGQVRIDEPKISHANNAKSNGTKG